MRDIVKPKTLNLFANFGKIQDGIHVADSLDKFYAFEELVISGKAKRVGCNEYNVFGVEALYEQNKTIIEEAIHARTIEKDSRKRRRVRLVKSVLKKGNGLKDGFVREFIYETYKGECVYCGEKLNGFFHIDHVLPKSKGGKDILENLVLSCQYCNLKKGARLPKEAGLPEPIVCLMEIDE